MLKIHGFGIIVLNDMTECERIIQQGIIPESFLKPEVICGFSVTSEMKKNWAVGIDLLVKFDEVCRRHQLNYFVAFGSLLGIIRHHGFIPWDDDIDVCMFRDDYEKLKGLRDEFEHPYFLQFPGLDNEYFFSYAKLRNSNTSCISKPFIYACFNQGIGMDIFPIDNCEIETVQDNYYRIKDLILENSANMRRNNPFPTEQDIERCKRYAKSNPYEVLERMETIAKQYNSRRTEYVISSTVTAYDYSKYMFKRNDVMDFCKMDFYGHPVSALNHYDAVLKVTYGDYMSFPPKEKRGVWHNNAIIDADVPYDKTIILLKEAYLKQ
jgi:lipopolysaccharide cholinephosphotransferase